MDGGALPGRADGGPVSALRPSRWRDQQAYTVGLIAPPALLTLWFLIPLGTFGPENMALSWTVFVLALALLATGVLWQIRKELLGLPGRPGLVILLLLCSALVVFATAYLGLASRPGELNGLHTKVDAMYFTVITMSTVGYGDITPVGQAARIVVMLQLSYTVVFLTTGVTAMTRHFRSGIEQRITDRHPKR